jgi:hypothetical protein
VSSKPNSNAFDLERDLPTSDDDVRVLARLRAASGAWLTGDVPVLDDEFTSRSLAERPIARAAWAPFELP